MHVPASAQPCLLVAPQILITRVVFIWPAGQAMHPSFLIEDAFGLATEFVWFEHFGVLAADPAVPIAIEAELLEQLDDSC